MGLVGFRRQRKASSRKILKQFAGKALPTNKNYDLSRERKLLGLGGERSEVMRNVHYCPYRQLPPGCDPGAGISMAPKTLQRGSRPMYILVEHSGCCDPK